MRLSELKSGESGMIVKVNGHGGFRKRIVEMGFIKGQMVEVLLNAPLRDPVKYRVMDYEVSLRHAESELIEVLNQQEAEQWEREHEMDATPVPAGSDLLRRATEAKGHVINVAFVGNPNCGKTSLFNIASGAHERVGNYSGVTVDAKTGHFEQEGYRFNITDLPGTYSLSAYTPEELYVRRHIIEQTPDVIVNVVDASNLERNLYLTCQLIDMDVPMIIALNMYDEFLESGNKLDQDQLGKLLGVKLVPTVGRTGAGVEELFHHIISIYEGHGQFYRHIHINHGQIIEKYIDTVESLVRVNPEPHHNYSARFISIKLLENDKQIAQIISDFENYEDIIACRKRCQQDILNEMQEDSETAITDAKYGYVQGALRECFVNVHKNSHSRLMTKTIDSIVTNRYLGFPIFFLLLYLMFYCTFNIGQYPMDWIDSLVGWLGKSISNSNLLGDGPLKDLIVDGIIAGVGGVIIFLPNIMILYAFISWMEDSGYMARAAFIMDRIMHKMGLHGKSFIPMVMGFGCSIPAVMATRTIEDRKSRLITMLIVPLMSCSARLPVYIIIIGAFFAHHKALVLLGLYTLGILMSVLMARLFSRYLVKGDSSPFVMELPPYRLPSWKSVFRHTWEKGRQYLKKMGTTILVASIIIWALSYYPRYENSSDGEEKTSMVANSNELQMKNSYIGQLGQMIEPVIRPCGFAWREGVSILAGTAAKEIVASTMGVLYSQTDAETEQLDDEAADEARLSGILRKSGMTTLSALSFMIFVLLYMPCIPTCIAIKNESGRLKWAFFTIVYTTLLAWVCSTLVYQVGSMM
ncbi:MAG: ferrous iron transport protein B [Bacteroidaceae bacterium]|nr:ferrous iron transport protein B [Bacteroidaceae bacterium]